MKKKVKKKNFGSNFCLKFDNNDGEEDSHSVFDKSEGEEEDVFLFYFFASNI